MLDVLLWAIVGVLAIAVLALARQVGVLNQRVAPAGALTPTAGPKVGELTEAMDVADLAGARHRIGGPDADETTLMLFISPTCPVCKALLPAAKSLAAKENLRLLFASDGFEPARHAAFASESAIDRFPYLLSAPLGMRYGVSRLPFAALIDDDGVLRGRGLVNSREHLESLVESWRTGVATLQDYMAENGKPSMFDPTAQDPTVKREA